jgi:serine/threonine protein kinase
MLGNPPQDIWKGESSPDIWSLGLVIYEMMTLVPIWSTAKCSVSCKSSECSTIPNVDKAGLLGMPGRDLKKLQSRQMTVQRQLIR